ncbi:RNA-binding protein lark OS=Drosophila melanogaster GN=lark PE=1 SV=1 [Rhizoctonia solani AG-1 IB]|uniref:RNA-binding protein lark n=1 Tax=Thanatephorus cucumeris (strain AG1-IB / isolate 7/3/14) TaxID=1108050 RepID=A0A0B7F2K0_THACB|nr:RNA-binding protein lark OS=Drosophila melanogaster GN=lark PE=1 SV=1 [Rhizoctonia solani AG-1 IB]
MSSPPATAVSSPARNGRDHIDGEREKTPMSGEPTHTNGASNGDSGPVQHADDNPPAPSSDSGNDSHSQKRGDKQIKPNKVYIGGLPEQTRQEDLQACFGKIGTIVSIELKLGYGFVEFDSREAAEESVAKYHEGYFMGNKIRVELSHGGGRTAKYVGEPGACFKCGTHGHWARECPHNVVPGYKGRDDRVDRKDYHHPPPYTRDYPPYRGDDYARYAASRDRYMDYYAAPPPAREYRGPPTRETREPYPQQPPRGGRDDEYRRIAPTPYRDDRAYYSHYEPIPAPPRDAAYRGYSGAVDRGRAPYPPGYPPAPAPARRDDYDRASSRDYPPPPVEYRSSHPPYRRRSTSPGHSRYPPDQRYASGYSGYPSSYSSGPPMPSSSRSGPPPARREASGY